MNPKEQDEWRGQTNEKLSTLVSAVTGGAGQPGLVKEVNDIKLRLAEHAGRMFAYGVVGSFLGSILTSIFVALLLKWVGRL